MYCKTTKLAMLLPVFPLFAILSSCKQPVHDAVYEELTRRDPEQIHLANIVAVGDSLPQSEVPGSSYVSITAVANGTITHNTPGTYDPIAQLRWAWDDTVPQPCTPPRPPCLQVAFDARLPFFGTDTIPSVTSFYPDTSFQRAGYNVEVMVRAAPHHLQGALYNITEIQPGERLYIMRISQR